MEVTCIPAEFIDIHLAQAKPEHIAVYLYGARHSPSVPSLRKTAEELRLRELDVVSAWTHWESAGLIKITDGSMDSFTCEYIGLEAAKASNKAPGAEVKTDTKKETKVVTRPNYIVTEMESFKQENEDVQYLFKMAERIFAEPLKYTMLNLLLGFYDWLLLPVPVIEVLLDYCVSNNHRNGRYLEKVALDWADNGISTVEEAEEYIKTFNTDYRAIMKSFGIRRRDPSPVEIEFMKRWLKEYNLTVDMITDACGQTVLNTGGISFPYAESILYKWSMAGYKTLEEALEHDVEYRKSRKEEKAKRPAAKKSRFADYQGRDWDFDKLEKMAAEFADRSV
ncbi:MAG: DnaD domain protein [Clostridiales bacterium]|jgi:DnaD/phage-associated family protein|nr:DnaD domain protein [Clostridiales bacterium]